MSWGQPNQSRQQDEYTVSKKRILFMDDDETFTKFISRALSRLGYEVSIAHEGDDAINSYKKAKTSGQPFDVVILDLMIHSGLDGKETIRKLTKIDPQIKAIISSGYSNHEYMTNYKAFGFRGAIAKPYTIDELSTTITEVLAETH